MNDRSFILMKISLLLAVIAVGSPWKSAWGAEPTKVLLLGDSTVITSYLPEEQQSQRALERELKVLKPEAEVEVINAADNGEFIARYLLSGAYERMRAGCAGADIIVVRFGTNDEKRMDAEEFGAQLGKFLDLLGEDFPGAKLILETGVYMDPNHFTSDRNKTLRPYWEKTRAMAAKRGLPVSEVYGAMERETAAGNWDLRIRKAGKEAGTVLDSSQDAGKENDRAWFANVHPNAEGVRVATRELARCIVATCPDGFPSGQKRKDRPAKSAKEYALLLEFPPERLVETKNPPWRSATRSVKPQPVDDLQQAVNPANQTPLVPSQP